MSDLDVLRKQYEHLTPYERAVMAMDAVSRRDESTIDALDPPSLWDAYHDISKRQIAPICSDEGMRCIPSEISGRIFLFRGAKLRDRLRFLRRGAFQRG